jgi:cytidylate kinase
MIVTIDGPAGSGKSTTARALARRLGFDFLDTGAMYRGVTLAAMRANVDVNDQSAMTAFVAGLHLEMPPGRVVLNGEDVTALIRTAAVTAASGAIASSPAVRRRLVALQRALSRDRNFVCEGRDQGTIVFPDALCKFYLTADPVERASRRQREMEARGDKVSLEEILAAQQARDARDAARDIAPMVPATDAVLLDTTGLSIDEVAARMEQEVRTRLSRPTP